LKRRQVPGASQLQRVGEKIKDNAWMASKKARRRVNVH